MRQIEFIYVGHKLRRVIFHRNTGSTCYELSVNRLNAINRITRSWHYWHLTSYYTLDGEGAEIIAEVTG